MFRSLLNQAHSLTPNAAKPYPIPLAHFWQRSRWRGGRHFGLCEGELSTFGTQGWGLSGIGGSNRRSLGYSWEPRQTLAASGPYLSAGYGVGPPSTIWRNRGAQHCRPRKYLGTKGMR